MPDNPNYADLFALLAITTDPILRQELEDQIYQFNAPLTPEEAQLFDYVYQDYIINNPGIQGNSFSSYVGIYISQEGEYTGDY